MKINNLYYNKPEKAHQLLRSVWAHTVTMEHGALLKGYYKDTDFPQFVAEKLIEEEEYTFSGGTHCRPYDKVFPGIRRMIEDMVTIYISMGLIYLKTVGWISVGVDRRVGPTSWV